MQAINIFVDMLACTGQVVTMVWTGKHAVSAARQLIGSTDPITAASGSIRADFGLSVDDNVCHGSDSVAAARREIEIWFPETVHQLVSL